MNPMVMKMTPAALIVGALLTLIPDAARAYTCRLSPAGDAIMVKTGNSSGNSVSCTVRCRFTTPQGPPFDVTCTQTIPANTQDWFVCIRPTAGKSVGAFEGGEEKCVIAPAR